MSTFFNAVGIPDNKAFNWEGLNINVIETTHVAGIKSCAIPSYGLLFDANGHTIFITTDTLFTPKELGPYYEKADLIFQDCETAENKSQVHAHYDELKTLDKSIKRKMWLYHYNPGKLPDAKKDGFKGFVKKSQSFDFNDPNTF